MRLLILGGTTEASVLAQALAARPSTVATLSLAGRTKTPALPPISCRIGGFGGIDGLANYLLASRTESVLDATHPFAAQMSAHAEAACARLGLPLATLTRPPWQPGPDDRWTLVPDLDAAALALGPAPARVFLASGRLGLKSFLAAPQHHYVIRSIDPPAQEDLPRDHRLILARGPFRVEDEIDLLRRERIDVLVSKNSGAAASEAKIAAARALGLPVIMVEPPRPPGGMVFTTVEEALGWIEAQRDASGVGPAWRDKSP